MLRAFSGADTFRSREAYVAAREAARGQGPIHVLRDEALTPERLAATLQGQPLFGSRPVVAIEELTALTGEAADAVIPLIAGIHTDLPVFVWERGAPFERSKVWRAIKEHADHLETFAPLTGAALERWVNDAVGAQGGTITRAATAALLAACEEDLWRVRSELGKLVLTVQGRAIAPEDVADVTPAVADADVFTTVRALATGEGAAALRHLAVHRARGDDPRIVLSMTIREVRTLLCIRDLLDRRERVTSWSVARDFRLPVAAAEALLAAARRATTATVRSLFDRLVVSLYALNTGRAEPDDVLDSVAFQAGAR